MCTKKSLHIRQNIKLRFNRGVVWEWTECGQFSVFKKVAILFKDFHRGYILIIFEQA